jgi:hypothetical protein
MGVDRYLEAQHEALSQYQKVCEKLRKAEAERDLARRMLWDVVHHIRPLTREERQTIERWREGLGE